MSDIDHAWRALMGRPDSPTLSLAKRVCHWCGEGDDGYAWEYVNSYRWYHRACIDLMDMTL